MRRLRHLLLGLLLLFAIGPRLVADDVWVPHPSRFCEGWDVRSPDSIRPTLSMEPKGGGTQTSFRAERSEFLAERLANPDLAVLLVVVGALLLYLEFNIPGSVIPGAAGVLAMTLGLYGLSMLPIRPSALLLLLAALALILLELKAATHGVLASAGILALVFGLLRLVDSSDAAVRVHTATAVGAGIGFGVITFGLAWIALLARRNKTLLGPQAMLGKLAVVRTPLAPAGQVEVRGELWQATLRDPAHVLPEGARVLIRQIDGLTLVVEAV